MLEINIFAPGEKISQKEMASYTFFKEFLKHFIMTMFKRPQTQFWGLQGKEKQKKAKRNKDFMKDRQTEWESCEHVDHP